MAISHRLLHEIDRLDSALNVVVDVSNPTIAQGNSQHFYKTEYPIALEDIKEALKTLRALASILATRESVPSTATLHRLTSNGDG